MIVEVTCLSCGDMFMADPKDWRKLAAHIHRVGGTRTVDLNMFWDEP